MMADEAAKTYRNNWVEKNPDFPMEMVASPKRVRVVFNGETIADSTETGLLREPGHVPVYYFPMFDVRMDLLSETDKRTHCPWKGHCRYFTLNAGGKVADNVAWTYADPYPQAGYLDGRIAFYWDRMDRWLEEDEAVFAHPRDPFKRVDIRASGREVRVLLAGVELARSNAARFLFETGQPTRFYLPKDHVRMDLLVPSKTRTSCPYKGNAICFDARSGDAATIVPDVAWSYPDPLNECTELKDLICFFQERVDAILVDNSLVADALPHGARVDGP